jgi:hypothetical protein
MERISKLKGTKLDKSPIVSKGCGSTYVATQFAIDDTIVFKTYVSASPHWDYGHRGVNMLIDEFYYPDEIELSEHDNSHRDGSLFAVDKQEIITLNNLNYHKNSNWDRFSDDVKHFVFGIFADDKRKLSEKYIAEHYGKLLFRIERLDDAKTGKELYLHVYQITSDLINCFNPDDDFDTIKREIEGNPEKNMLLDGFDNWDEGYLFACKWDRDKFGHTLHTTTTISSENVWMKFDPEFAKHLINNDEPGESLKAQTKRYWFIANELFVQIQIVDCKIHFYACDELSLIDSRRIIPQNSVFYGESKNSLIDVYTDTVKGCEYMKNKIKQESLDAKQKRSTVFSEKYENLKKVFYSKINDNISLFNVRKFFEVVKCLKRNKHHVLKGITMFETLVERYDIETVSSLWLEYSAIETPQNVRKPVVIANMIVLKLMNIPDAAIAQVADKAYAWAYVDAVYGEFGWTYQDYYGCFDEFKDASVQIQCINSFKNQNTAIL